MDDAEGGGYGGFRSRIQLRLPQCRIADPFGHLPFVLVCLAFVDELLDGFQGVLLELQAGCVRVAAAGSKFEHLDSGGVRP